MTNIFSAKSKKQGRYLSFVLSPDKMAADIMTSWYIMWSEIKPYRSRDLPLTKLMYSPPTGGASTQPAALACMCACMCVFTSAPPSGRHAYTGKSKAHVYIYAPIPFRDSLAVAYSSHCLYKLYERIRCLIERLLWKVKASLINNCLPIMYRLICRPKGLV